MPSVTESLGQASQLDAAFRAGLQSIDRNQRIQFTQYQRKVLPLDGYVFWIATGISITVPGSLHYAADMQQNEDETIAVNRIVFTSEQEVQEFNTVSPGILWVGTLGNAAASSGPTAPGIASLVNSPVVFAFSSRDYFYRKADIYHYSGIAVQAPLLSQLVNTQLDLPDEPIVSNSLPIWLGFTDYGPVYPSFLVPDNVAPPYIVAHIEPSSTQALQAFPTFDSAMSYNANPPPTLLPGTPVPNSGTSPLYQQPSQQLVCERVRLTLYGMTNQTAIQFMVYVNQNSLDTESFGVMNMPAIHDEKRTQVEMSMIAQKKTIEYEIDYYQSTADAIARRLILSATASLSIASL